METKFVIQTAIEIVLLGAVILTFWKEKALIAFEEKIAAKFKNRSHREGGKAFVVHEGGRGAHCA